MAKIMRTIEDVKSEIRDENLSTKPLLADDYTYGNIDNLTEIIEDEISGEAFSDHMDIKSPKDKKKKNR